ncbi:hypothetical protein QKW60_04420 [Defluviimonas aestuarii]|uniref:hypothetical protein n=1 Tax=Albidovulum aestuarii TaxID=1130726 RepID=UPI00249B34BD|nr:hypothetical protein [Defluviimonas aestuarii]MDI3335638.1 hypothetical protein [Defluviimonas aestuarii]
MIEPDHPDLSIGQQCKLLSIARSSFYYTPKGETERNLGLMRRIDENGGAKVGHGSGGMNLLRAAE